MLHDCHWGTEHSTKDRHAHAHTRRTINLVQAAHGAGQKDISNSEKGGGGRGGGGGGLLDKMTIVHVVFCRVFPGIFLPLFPNLNNFLG